MKYKIIGIFLCFIITCIFFEVIIIQIYNLKQAYYIVEIDRLKSEIVELKKIPEANPKILQWVKKKANFSVTDEVLIDIILETQKYDYGLLILAMIAEESKFRTYAHSKKDARGLTQIIPRFWLTELKKAEIINDLNDLWDYRKNIASCNYILNDYFKKYKNLRNVLMHYVNGSEKYTKNVMKNYIELKSITKYSDNLKRVITIN